MRKRLWVAGTAAVLALAITAAPAVAAVTRTWLSASKTAGYYGDDIALGPDANATLVPGDKFEFQRYDTAQGWLKIEEQTVEETDTVDPLYLIVGDAELKFPMTVRSVYRPLSSKNETAAVSPAFSLSALKYRTSTVDVKAPKTAKRGSSFTSTIAVTPNPGPGKVELKIYRKAGSKYVRSKTVKVTLDEAGEGTVKFKPATRRTYQLRARFLGNAYSVKSGTDVATVRVR